MQVWQQLEATHRHEVWQFCLRNPDTCVQVTAWLCEGGLTKPQNDWLWGYFANGFLTGLMVQSTQGLLQPVELKTEAIDAFVGVPHQPQLQGALSPTARARVLTGERKAVAALSSALITQGAHIRLVRDQHAFGLAAGELVDEPDTQHALNPPKSVALEIASTADLPEIVALSAAMAKEEAGDDPASRNPKMFQRAIEERLMRNKDFVLRRDGQIVFKANVASLSPENAQIEGIYTLPAYRRQGLGHAGTAALTAWVLARAKRALLFVNDDNENAIRIYQKLGYRKRFASRVTFLEY